MNQAELMQLTKKKLCALVAEKDEEITTAQGVVVNLLRPFANKDRLEMADRIRKLPSDGVDVGVRLEALRAAVEFVAEYDDRDDAQA